MRSLPRPIPIPKSRRPYHPCRDRRCRGLCPAGHGVDREALDRGNSVYFPDRVVPMLPEKISNDLCSLKANEDRPALAMRIVITADGRKLSHRVHRIMMRSAAKLAYAQVQAAWDGMPGPETKDILERCCGRSLRPTSR